MAEQQTLGSKRNPLVIVAIVVGAAFAACVLGVVVLYVLGSGDEKPSAASSSAPAAAVKPTAGIPPKPDAATQAAYIAALDAIDADIVHGKPDDAVSRGRDTCASIADHKGGEAAFLLAQQRFTSPDHPDGFDMAKVQRIMEAVHLHLCPTY